MSQIRRRIQIPHLPWLEQFSSPALRLPTGVRAAVVVLGMAGLVTGVRVLGSQIAGAAGSQLLMETRNESAITPSSLFAGESRKNRYQFVWVSVSGYTSRQDQTDADPWTTASGTRPGTGTVALSRDLLRSFTPGAPFEFGDGLLIPGMGVYVVEDAMAPRWTQRADIWFADNQSAQCWGVRDAYVARVDAENYRITDSGPRRWPGLCERETIPCFATGEQTPGPAQLENTSVSIIKS